MKIDCEWNGKNNFIATINGFRVSIDGSDPLSDQLRSHSKHFALASLCSGMGLDIVTLLKKSRQPPKKFRIEANAVIENIHPYEMTFLKLKYFIEGLCSREIVTKAIDSSQDKYRIASTIISANSPVISELFMNGKAVGQGRLTAFPQTIEVQSKVEIGVTDR